MNLTQKIIGSHLVSGTMTPGSEIGLRIDQTLTQDATGTMAWLQFEALGIPRVKTDISLSYVDHNTLQMNFRNPDDHRFLRTVAAKFGGVYSGPGTGICHQLHLENFAKPGATLVGSDSHTPTAGGICSLAMGAGGLSVALAMAGEPYYIPMPKVVRVFLTGALTGWASAKDVMEIVEEIDYHQIPAIFTEVNGSDATAQMIHRECGVTVRPLTLMMGATDGTPGIALYLDLLWSDVNTLREAYA